MPFDPRAHQSTRGYGVDRLSMLIYGPTAVRARHSSSRRGFPVLNRHTGLGRYEIARRMRLEQRARVRRARVPRPGGRRRRVRVGRLVVTEWERVEALAAGGAQR